MTKENKRPISEVIAELHAYAEITGGGPKEVVLYRVLEKLIKEIEDLKKQLSNLQS